MTDGGNAGVTHVACEGAVWYGNIDIATGTGIGFGTDNDANPVNGVPSEAALTVTAVVVVVVVVVFCGWKFTKVLGWCVPPVPAIDCPTPFICAFPLALPGTTVFCL